MIPHTTRGLSPTIIESQTSAIPGVFRDIREYKQIYENSTA